MPDDDESALLQEVGLRIRAQRKARGMSMHDVVTGGFVGSQSYLSKLERGQVRPGVHTLQRLADGFGVHIRELLPDAPVDREAMVERVVALSDDELRALDALLRVIAGQRST